MAKRAHDKTVEMNASHVAYMSHPKETAKLIEEAAASSTRRTDFGKFLHRQVFLRRAEKVLDFRHSPNLLRLSDGLSAPRCLSCSACPQI